jgi:hypothetical protein
MNMPAREAMRSHWRAVFAGDSFHAGQSGAATLRLLLESVKGSAKSAAALPTDAIQECTVLGLAH